MSNATFTLVALPSARRSKRLSEVQVAHIEKCRALVKKLSTEAGLTYVAASQDGTKNWSRVQVSDATHTDKVRISLDKNSETVFLVGFTITDHPAVEQVSAEQAKERHLGHVRGEVDLLKDGAMDALRVAIKGLGGLKK